MRCPRWAALSEPDDLTRTAAPLSSHDLCLDVLSDLNWRPDGFWVDDATVCAFVILEADLLAVEAYSSHLKRSLCENVQMWAGDESEGQHEHGQG